MRRDQLEDAIERGLLQLRKKYPSAKYFLFSFGIVNRSTSIPARYYDDKRSEFYINDEFLTVSSIHIGMGSNDADNHFRTMILPIEDIKSIFIYAK